MVGIVITTVVVIGLFGLTFWAQRDLAAPGEPIGVSVEVIGHQFWWEVRYPDENVVTANEVHIPTGKPVAIRLTSDNVIHSFWVPQLADKLDLIPGRVNEYWIEADVPGVYHGQCAEFCGISHALMQLNVIAEPQEQFDAWINGWKAGPAQLSARVAGTGDVSKAPASMGVCIACHRIEGTNLNVAPPQVGPNLTLFGCRIHAVSGLLPNTPENLAKWLSDPGAIKPGNYMATVIKPGVLDEQMIVEIVGYLESLKPEGGCPPVTGENLPEHVASPAANETAIASAIAGAENAQATAAANASQTGAQATPASAPQGPVEVEMVDINFVPKEITIPAGTDVTINLVNKGAAVHNFTVNELDVQSGDYAPGQTGTVTINAAPGDYEYYCSIPGHKEAGMVGTLHVT